MAWGRDYQKVARRLGSRPEKMKVHLNFHSLYLPQFLQL